MIPSTRLIDVAKGTLIMMFKRAIFCFLKYTILNRFGMLDPRKKKRNKRKRKSNVADEI